MGLSAKYNLPWRTNGFVRQGRRKRLEGKPFQNRPNRRCQSIAMFMRIGKLELWGPYSPRYGSTPHLMVSSDQTSKSSTKGARAVSGSIVSVDEESLHNDIENLVIRKTCLAKATNPTNEFVPFLLKK